MKPQLEHLNQIEHFIQRSKPQIVVGYHDACSDGFAAAYVVDRWLKDNRLYSMLSPMGLMEPVYIPLAYDNVADYQSVLKVADTLAPTLLILVDFSYRGPKLIELLKKFDLVVILDHHETARDVENEVYQLTLDGDEREMLPLRDRLVYRYSPTQSGAVMAYEFFNPDQTAWSMVYEYVQDRDLWQHALPLTKEVSAFIRVYGSKDFSAFGSVERMLKRCDKNPKQFTSVNETLIREAAQHILATEAALRQRQIRDSLCVRKVGPEWATGLMHEGYDGADIPIIKMPKNLMSDALHELLEQHPASPFAMGLAHRRDGRIEVSLRSRKGQRSDMGALAKMNGGGGHYHAAGFSVTPLQAARYFES